MGKTGTGAGNVTKEEREKTPMIVSDKWIRISDDKKEVKIDEAMPKSTVKIILSVLDFDDGNEINITIFDNTDEDKKELTKVKAKVSGKTATTEDITIDKKWVAKKLKIKVEDPEYAGKSELEITPIEFAELKIQVIDCRSNQPVSNAKVKELIIKEGNVEKIKETFDRTKDRKNATPLIRNSMEVLQSLGFGANETIPADGNYNAAWRKNYNDHWDKSAPDCITELTSGNPPDDMMTLLINHYNSHRATNNNGILKIYIPKPLLENKKELTIEVGFFDFPIVLERINGGASNKVLRNNQESQGTGFNITWNGTQSTAWNGNFGWVIENGTEESSELKVSETITVKTDKDNVDFDSDILSTFHDNNKHFVLFAMQWCQPVWDGIEDDSTRSHVQDARYSNLNMHICTTYFDVAGSDPYGGKGYGKAESRNTGTYLWRSDGHRGIDLHAILGDNVFAVHGGIITTSNSTLGGNQSILQLVVNDNTLSVGYLHLNDYVLTNNQYAMSGQIIAHAGRTGNLGAISRWPGHVHLNLNVQPIHVIGIRNSLSQLYVNNLNVIPCNEYPLLFPCSCAITDNDNPVNCNFNNTTFVSPCWAVAELRCPHIWNDRNRRIQAQLRSIGLYSLSIDGQWGNLPTSATSTISRTRQGIYHFKENNNLLETLAGQTFNPANYDMDPDTDDDVLNNLVPINVDAPAL